MVGNHCLFQSRSGQSSRQAKSLTAKIISAWSVDLSFKSVTTHGLNIVEQSVSTLDSSSTYCTEEKRMTVLLTNRNGICRTGDRRGPSSSAIENDVTFRSVWNILKWDCPFAKSAEALFLEWLFISIIKWYFLDDSHQIYIK
jgi:hypothetical protein